MINDNQKAESHRIRALALLAKKDLLSARLEIEKASELRPKWESVRFTAAKIYFYSAISSSEIPVISVPWPQPIDPIFLKRDNESISFLQKSISIFKELVNIHKCEQRQLQIFQSWLLASLLINQDSYNEGVDFCKEVLKSNPIHYRVLVWAISYRLKIDYSLCIIELEKLLNNNKIEIDHILVIIGYYIDRNEEDKAMKLLEKMKGFFDENKQDSLWIFWYAQILLKKGEIEKAIQNLDILEESDTKTHAMILALQEKAEKENDWKPLLDYIEGCYNNSNEARFLLIISRLKARLQDWKYIADRAEELLQKIPTIEVLRIVSNALINTNQYDNCLELLDRHIDFFPARKLSPDLQQIHMICQKETGSLVKAVEEARMVSKDDPSFQNKYNLVGALIELGNIREASIYAQELLDSNELSAQQALFISQRLSFEDSEIAKKFYHKAIQIVIPDDLVVTTVALCFTLGLDSESGQLITRMQELAIKGHESVRIETIENVKEYFKRDNIGKQKFWDDYSIGSIPIHTTERLGIPLVDLYHRMLSDNENENGIFRKSPLFIRHGSRELRQGFPDKVPQGRLHLDMTAILLAHHLEILDKVENTFKPLVIPPEIQKALQKMAVTINSHYQITLLENYKKILQLIEKGKIQVMEESDSDIRATSDLIEEIGEEEANLLEYAKRTNGYFVCFLPIKKRGALEPAKRIDDTYKNVIVNCRTIAEALYNHGPLSKTDYKSTLLNFGNEGQQQACQILPELKSQLICDFAITELFASSEILEIMCENYYIKIGKSERDFIKNKLYDYEKMQSLIAWLQSLTERISEGLLKGVYEIPKCKIYKGDGAISLTDNPAITSLYSLLTSERNEKDAIWIDDRNINSFRHFMGTELIGINEILKIMCGANIISKEEYYRLLIKLRNANVRFIPLEKEELIYHLGNAAIKDGELKETRELSSIRQYFSACLIQNNFLQKPYETAEKQYNFGEVGFVMALNRAILDTFVELWRIYNADLNSFTAMANWIYENMFLSLNGFLNVSNMPTAEQDFLNK